LRVEFVEGLVTMDGKPVVGASVTFFPITNAPPIESASGSTDENGIYRLSSQNGAPLAGAVAGKYRVTVMKSSIQPNAAGIEEHEDLLDYDAPPTHHYLPAIYRDHQNTPLKATVNKGRNRIDFELASNP
jgi:hypothetical protein